MRTASSGMSTSAVWRSFNAWKVSTATGTLRINTAQQPQLRPASPPVTINTRDADDVYVKTVEFDEEVIRRPVVHHGPVRTGPVRIPTHRPAGGGFF